MPLPDHEKPAYEEKFLAEAGLGSALPMTKLPGLMRTLGWTPDQVSDETLLGWFSPGDAQTLTLEGFIDGLNKKPSSKQLLRARATRFYNSCDTDKNKGLTKEEFKTFMTADGTMLNDWILNGYFSTANGACCYKDYAYDGVPKLDMNKFYRFLDC